MSTKQHVLKKLQQRVKHPTPDKLKHASADYSTPNYGQRKMRQKKNKLKKLSPEGIRRTQEIIGSCLCFCRVTDLTPLVAIITASSQQSKATEVTNISVKILFDYIITLPGGTVTYVSSYMVIWVQIYGACLAEEGANNRVGGHYL